MAIFFLFRFMVFLFLFHSTLCNKNCCKEEKDATGKTFLFTRPVYEQLCIHCASWHNPIGKKEEKSYGMQCIVLSAASRKQKQEKALFLFGYKEALLIASDEYGDLLNERDIRADWFGEKNLRGIFSFVPTQEQSAVCFRYTQGLDALSSFFSDAWISIFVPFVSVTNRLLIEEQDLLRDERKIDTLSFLFHPKEWLYAKQKKEQSLLRIADGEVALGRSYQTKSDLLFTYYSKMIIPSGKSTTPEYLFDPVVGNNGHFGIGTGICVHCPLNKDTSLCEYAFFLGLEGVFFARTTQMRIFDLKNNPWSRYLPFVEKKSGLSLSVPGTTILTRLVRVRPYGTIDLSTGYRFHKAFFEGELGYNLWCRSEETIELECSFPEERYGIAGEGVNDENEPATASESTIAHRAANDPFFVAIRASDIDLSSGASPGTLQHTFHGAINIVQHGAHRYSTCGVGGFITFPQHTTALSLWGVWVHWGVIF